MLRLAGHSLTWLGWLLAAASLLAPATTALERAGTPPGTPLVGWEALVAIAAVVFHPLVWFFAPELLWLGVIVVGALLLLAMPPVLSVAKDEAGILQAPLVFVPAALLLLPESLQRSLCWGIWIWVAAFIAVAAGGIVRCVGAALAPEADLPLSRSPAWVGPGGRESLAEVDLP
jgi:hypothetical protein